MDTSTAMSPADIAALMSKSNDEGWGNGGAWWIILLFICLFGGGFGGWGYGNGAAAGVAASNAVSNSDLQRVVDLNSIQEGQGEINANVQRIGYEVGGIVKDSSYNNLSEIRDVQAALTSDTHDLSMAMNTGFTNTATGMCSLGKQISENKYEAALNTAAINANIDAKFAAIEKTQLQQTIAAQQDQIDSLRLSSAMCGVPRINPFIYTPYPTYGPGPLYNGTAFN